jgi:hypothetical protein
MSVFYNQLRECVARLAQIETLLTTNGFKVFFETPKFAAKTTVRQFCGKGYCDLRFGFSIEKDPNPSRNVKPVLTILLKVPVDDDFDESLSQKFLITCDRGMQWLIGYQEGIPELPDTQPLVMLFKSHMAPEKTTQSPKGLFCEVPDAVAWDIIQAMIQFLVEYEDPAT